MIRREYYTQCLCGLSMISMIIHDSFIYHGFFIMDEMLIFIKIHKSTVYFLHRDFFVNLPNCRACFPI